MMVAMRDNHSGYGCVPPLDAAARVRKRVEIMKENCRRVCASSAMIEAEIV
jgi:hypothetical protein